ncbi:30S ribosomal protein S4 [bacterium]|nr:30S ribosomal protein S4 [bacterium]
MGRYIGPVCRLCRREGAKLFLKGERCFSNKCSLTTKAYPPGEQKRARFRKRMSDFGIRLREKQKVRRIYGVMEAQFRRYFHEAARLKGKTGENLLQLLELRLSNIVFRLGFSPSRRAARQLVSHGHFQVNGRKVTVPSYRTKPGDIIQVQEKSKTLSIIHNSLKKKKSTDELPWLSLDKAKLEGRILNLPTRDEIPVVTKEQLIVEYYSR